MANPDVFAKAQRDALVNRYTCRGPCKLEGKLDEAIAIWFQHSLVLAVCKPCFDKVDVVMRRSEQGVSVKIVERSAIAIR